MSSLKIHHPSSSPPEPSCPLSSPVHGHRPLSSSWDQLRLSNLPVDGHCPLAKPVDADHPSVPPVEARRLSEHGQDELTLASDFFPATMFASEHSAGQGDLVRVRSNQRQRCGCQQVIPDWVLSCCSAGMVPSRISQCQLLRHR